MMCAFAVAFVIGALVAPDRADMLNGSVRLCAAPAQLTKDWFLPGMGGVSASMLNAAIVSAMLCALTFLPGAEVNGATVLGVGDTPYDALDQRVRDSLDEYYWVPSLEDYGQVFRAVAYFSWKWGKVDWVESQNEYWLAQDARLRDDFHVTTGAGSELMARWQSKAEMKPLYAAAGVPTARQALVADADACRALAAEAGYPLFTKPERGVGAGGARKIKDADALDRVRLGGMDHGGLDVRYLRTPEAHALVDYANTLLHALAPR